MLEKYKTKKTEFEQIHSDIFIILVELNGLLRHELSKVEFNEKLIQLSLCKDILKQNDSLLFYMKNEKISESIGMLSLFRLPLFKSIAITSVPLESENLK